MKCYDCGGQNARVVGNGRGGYLLRCADCEILAVNPDAERMPPMPRERQALPLQGGTLFDASVYVDRRKGGRR
jgi:hypothetical protein